MLETENYLKVAENSINILRNVSGLPQKKEKTIEGVIRNLTSIKKDTSVGRCDDIIMDSVNDLVELTFVIGYEPRMKVQKALQPMWDIHHEYLREYMGSGF